MNRDEAKKLLPIIQAYADGATVEAAGQGEQWIEIWNPGFSRPPESYRIKPKPTKRLRPYKPEELPPVKTTLVSKTSGIECDVTGVDRQSDDPGVLVGARWCCAEKLLREWQHMDGSPCGAEEEV